MWLLLLTLACSADKSSGDSRSTDSGSPDSRATDSGSTDSGSADSGSTDDSGLPTGLIDADGDGAPAPAQGLDPATFDCDDTDPAVNPTTERYLPAGVFLRGDPAISDAPRQEVTLSAFCLDVTEVTNTPYAAFVTSVGPIDDEGHVMFDENDTDDTIPERITCSGGICAAEPGYEDHPATELSWYGADRYCRSLGKHLPTEAEWERGARGACGDDGCDETDARTWPWGEDEPDCDHVNASVEVGWDDNGLPNAFESCVGDTSVVGTPAADVSPDGILGMGGNVQEFTGDWYNADYYTDGPDVDPPGPESGVFTDPDFGTQYEARVARGGSWASDFAWAAVARRWGEKPEATSNGLGFRCARSM